MQFGRGAQWGLGPASIVGLVAVAATAIVYPLIRDTAGEPLALFVLAPLGVAVVADHVQTRLVAVAAVIASVLEGLATGMEPAPLLVRMVIIAGGSALAVLGALLRARRELELRRSEVQREVLTAFQDGLVPVPAPPRGVVATSRYRPAQVPLRIGGDFVDVIALPDGAAGFVIGDVCGHGPRSAAFGARIRAAWKGVAWTIPDQPARWLEQLDAAFFTDGRFDGFVTAFAGHLTAQGEVRASCAGHPPPLLRSGRQVHMVELTPDLPLGIDPARRRRTTTFRLEPDATMLLYTDGLIENRGTPGGRAGDDGLRAALTTRELVSLDDLLDAFGPHGYDDDVAVLELRTRAVELDPAPAVVVTGTDSQG